MTQKKCYESHPGLEIKPDLPLIYGGNCGSPIVTDADVYIAFDSYLYKGVARYPWHPQYDSVSFLFAITDMSVPSDVGEFKNCVSWVHSQMKEGKKVHVGCIGGHGRTGLFLAALHTVITGQLDSITYVRKNYCSKAVESESQVNWLNKHFGITKVKASKSDYSKSSKAWSKPYKSSYHSNDIPRYYNPKPVKMGASEVISPGSVKASVFYHLKAKK